MMFKINQKKGLPRLAAVNPASNSSFTMSRGDILTGKLPVFWGPSQPAPDVFGEYFPPNDWAKVNTLLRVPRVARFFFETVTILTDVTIASWMTGTYSYGVHTDSFDLDITTPSSFYPTHTHTTSLADAGTAQYAIEFDKGFSGHDYLPGVGSFDATGTQKNWYSTFYVAPFHLEVYEDRSSTLYELIGIIDALQGQHLNLPPSTALFGLPHITTTSYGPYSGGLCAPVKVGTFSINGIGYGTAIPYPELGMIIPAGWAQPPPLQVPSQTDAIHAVANAQYAAYNQPKSVSFDWFDRSSGYNFLDLVTPSATGFFGTRTVSFLMFSTWHTIPDQSDPRIALIKASFAGFADYKVVVLIDQDSFDDILAATSTNDTSVASAVGLFMGGINSLVSSLAEYGWTMETVGYKNLNSVSSIVSRYIGLIG